jgi:phosphomannomutase / phosphoglucomutase
MKLDGSVFRKYDIRGVFPGDLHQRLITGLGAALGAMTPGPVAVGRDCRPSGELLFRWLASGIAHSGREVLDLGVQTSPMTYYAAHILRPSITVMITGSHNPPEYNGFKIMLGLVTMHGEDIQGIMRAMDRMEDLPAEPPVNAPEPRKVSVEEPYFRRLLSEFSLDRSLRVVVDAGNGTGGVMACRVLEALGCRVIPLYCDMDGSFPNHHPDPTVLENLTDLRRMVVETGSDLGIAFDGDADRLGVVDETGEVVFGDRVLVLLAREVLRVNPGAAVISEVKASDIFFREVEKAGGRALMSPTGHSLIKKAMIEQNALLAGEMSGHIFFRDRYYGFDDALYAALRLLEVLASGTESLGRLMSSMPRLHSTPELREDCPDGIKFRVVDEVRRALDEAGLEVDATDGVRVRFLDGWGLVRASNTQPVLVLRFEAGTPEELLEYEHRIRTEVKRARRKCDVETAGGGAGESDRR